MSNAFIVVGLGYGDEGKGTIVDYLTRQHGAHTVIRFNGGAQAAHNVITPDGLHHTFAQFGSGTLAGAHTYLSRYMIINPFDFYLEAQHLKYLGITDPYSLVSFSPEALVTTPLHIAANQIREEFRSGKHGTCGKGIGETQFIYNVLGDTVAVKVKDLYQAGVVESKLNRLSEFYCETLAEDFYNQHGKTIDIAKSYQDFQKLITIREDKYVRSLIDTGHTVIFEGAQGILLDQDVGFHPHTTWSHTTSRNARILADDADDLLVIGVTRAYSTRHGEGPFFEGLTAVLDEQHNSHEGLQGRFRHGPWDAIALDYAAKCDSIDEVAVTCLDQIDNWESVWSYDYFGDMPDLLPYFWAEGRRIFQINTGHDRAHSEAITTRLKYCKANINMHEDVDSDYIIDAIGEVLHAPVTIQSFGPSSVDKKSQVLTWT